MVVRIVRRTQIGARMLLGITCLFCLEHDHRDGGRYYGIGRRHAVQLAIRIRTRFHPGKEVPGRGRRETGKAEQRSSTKRRWRRRSRRCRCRRPLASSIVVVVVVVVSKGLRRIRSTPQDFRSILVLREASISFPARLRRLRVSSSSRSVFFSFVRIFSRRRQRGYGGGKGKKLREELGIAFYFAPSHRSRERTNISPRRAGGG